MKQQFDNHDNRIKYYELMLERNLNDLPHFPLPEGYRYVFYQEGDRDRWIDIEKSAKEFTSYEQGLESWNRYYGGRENTLTNRMVFIEDTDGRKVATATAYYDVRGIDQSGDGWLHWVAVRREYQGRGLAKPLITHVLDIMRCLGYTHAKIPTQTTTWLACKVYLDLGFRPIPENAVHSRDGWRIVKALTDHAALEEFDPAAVDEISVER
jgi:GNAT superfamily N-acetyltransferase